MDNLADIVQEVAQELSDTSGNAVMEITQDPDEVNPCLTNSKKQPKNTQLALSI